MQMKIIQVVGLANSGKTSFIKNLIPVLGTRGKVAVIKHLGDHEFGLEDGKDTTDFFESGAQISVGVDSQKSVITLRKTALDEILCLLSDQKMDYVILEGFKQRMFPKIVIGDLKVEKCILENPTVNDVIDSLHLFEDYNK